MAALKRLRSVRRPDVAMAFTNTGGNAHAGFLYSAYFFMSALLSLRRASGPAAFDGSRGIVSSLHHGQLLWRRLIIIRIIGLIYCPEEDGHGLTTKMRASHRPRVRRYDSIYLLRAAYR